jgi:hypothetical protein
LRIPVTGFLALPLDRRGSLAKHLIILNYLLCSISYFRQVTSLSGRLD